MRYFLLMLVLICNTSYGNEVQSKINERELINTKLEQYQKYRQVTQQYYRKQSNMPPYTPMQIQRELALRNVAIRIKSYKDTEINEVIRSN